MGALGIALLAARASSAARRSPPSTRRRFLGAKVESKDTFVCGSTSGCGGGGNKCRIDRLTTRARGRAAPLHLGRQLLAVRQGDPQRGSCPTARRTRSASGPSSWRTSRARLSAPARRAAHRAHRRLPAEGALPVLRHVPARARARPRRGRARRPRGAEARHRGGERPLVRADAAVPRRRRRPRRARRGPRLRADDPGDPARRAASAPRSSARSCRGARTCCAGTSGAAVAARLVSPVIDVGPGALDAPAFVESCRRLAAQRRRAAREGLARGARRGARRAQLAFDARLLELGRAALDRCATGRRRAGRRARPHLHHPRRRAELERARHPARAGGDRDPARLLPGRATTRPIFENMFWGHGQRILRAAWQVRRSPGVYALFASNYSCGPDSFTLHFVQDLMDGKPFAVIETDGHAGDAGTKTRVEAFLHCVARAPRRGRAPPARAPPSGSRCGARPSREIARLAASACSSRRWPTPPTCSPAALRGVGLPAEVLPEPGPEALRLGRRHTSGKECLPMTLTLGSLLERLERAAPGERFAFFMPGADGPCRFGAYKELHQLVLDRLGLARPRPHLVAAVRRLLPGHPPGARRHRARRASSRPTSLRDMLHDVRPRETRAGRGGRRLPAPRSRSSSRSPSARRGAISPAAGCCARSSRAASGACPPCVARAGAELAALRGARGPPARAASWARSTCATSRPRTGASSTRSSAAASARRSRA